MQYFLIKSLVISTLVLITIGSSGSAIFKLLLLSIDDKVKRDKLYRLFFNVISISFFAYLTITILLLAGDKYLVKQIAIKIYTLSL